MLYKTNNNENRKCFLVLIKLDMFYILFKSKSFNTIIYGRYRMKYRCKFQNLYNRSLISKLTWSWSIFIITHNLKSKMKLTKAWHDIGLHIAIVLDIILNQNSLVWKYINNYFDDIHLTFHFFSIQNIKRYDFIEIIKCYDLQ